MTLFDFMHEHPGWSFTVVILAILAVDNIVHNLCQVAEARRKDGEK